MPNPNDITDGVLASLQPEFELIPDAIAHPLQEAVRSGMTQAHVSSSGMLANADTLAADWADDRAAELVGMKYDDAGNLVVNPSAEWSIEETTREAIRRIVTEAFSDPATTMEDIEEAIDDSGIFSDDRAAMIAHTEVAQAQMQGSITAWRESGMVKTVDVLLSADDPCDECKEIADGGPYPLEQIAEEYPFHPNCNCTLVAVDIADE